MANEIKWIKVSVSLFDDEKIKQIRSMPGGDTMILVWLQLLLLAGRVHQDGLLVLSNTEIPYTEEMMATQFDVELNTVKLAVETFKRFGMVEIIDDIYHITNWAKHQAADGMEKIREQNRERKKAQRERSKELSPVPAAPALPAPEPPEEYARLPLVTNGEYHVITKEDVEKYQELYPGIDVPQEIRKMIGWCDANPKNRKTKTGVKRFINSWLSRAQDRAPRQNNIRDNALYPQANPGIENWDQ